MTAVTVSAETDRGRWRGVLAMALVTMAGALLVAMTWAVVEVVWFVETSAYCAETTCTEAAMVEAEQPAGAPAGDLMMQGEDAFEAAGGSSLAITFGYLPITVMALVLVLGLLGLAAAVWGWAPSTWRRHVRDGTARRSVQVALAVVAAVGGVVLLYAVNLSAMAWFTYVTE